MSSFDRPLDWRTWCGIADHAASSGRWSDAVHALQQAAALKPGDATIARNLGAALANVGRSDEALVAYEAGSAIDRTSIRGRLDYAQLLIDLGRRNDAMTEVEQVAKLALSWAPDRAPPVLRPDDGAVPVASTAHLADVRDLALLLDRLNDVVGLGRLLAEAEKAGITREALGSLWASLALREGRPEEARQILLQNRSEFDDAHWDRMMVKVADALGDAEGAFAAATAMNRAAHGYSDWRRRAAEYRAQIRATARIVTPDWASRIPKATDDGVRSPAFIVGFPRSGTTLLDTFLMGHPETHVIEEGRMLEFATAIISESPGVDWPAELVVRARKAYLDELTKHVAPGFSGLIIDKHPMNMLYLAVLNALFPNAKVVFVQRHPCDVVLSGFMQSFHLNQAMANFLDLGHAADLYDAAMTMWTRSRDAVPQAIHPVVYERLIVDPGAELKPTLKFLGLEWRDDLLDHQGTARARGLIPTASYDQVVQELSRAPIGRWRRFEKQLAPVLPVLLPWAERLGYTG